MTPRFPFCCFFRFQSPRSLRIDCHQSLSGLFLPLSVAPARPRRTSGFTVGWSFSARGFRRFPFCCYRTPGYRRIPFTFTPFLSFPGLSPYVSLFLSLGCECQLTHWSPELGQRVVPPFRRFHTATNRTGCRGSIMNVYLRLPFECRDTHIMNLIGRFQ